jgi:dTDP-4-amino-4,6-dideoxygalactose transaminase
MSRRLAILGGSPAFEAPMHVGRPNLPDRRSFHSYVDRIFDGRWLTNSGPLVRELEERLCEFTGVSSCIPICNGTIALELATRAMGFSGEVILPSFTFIASAHSLKWQEIEPVFCDIDERSLTIDPARIEELVTPRTTGILGVHVYGNPCDTDAIGDIASRLGLGVVYDAAHAFGNRIAGRPVGTFGGAEVFSFHATKFFNTFEGGAVATNDADLAKRIRLMMNFGFGGREKDQVDYLGTNGKMTEICAAMGLAMLDCVEDVREINRANFEAYAAASDGIPGASLVEPPDTLTQCNWQYVILRIDEGRSGLSRDDLVRVLEAENVLARRYFYPGCHRMHPYSARPVSPILPVTDRVAREVLSLPTGQSVDRDAAGRICDIISEACRLSGEVKATLAGTGGA